MTDGPTDGRTHPLIESLARDYNPNNKADGRGKTATNHSFESHEMKGEILLSSPDKSQHQDSTHFEYLTSGEKLLTQLKEHEEINGCTAFKVIQLL